MISDIPKIILSTFSCIIFALLLNVMTMEASAQAPDSNANNLTAKQKNISELVSKLSPQEIDVLSKLLSAMTTQGDEEKASALIAGKKETKKSRTLWLSFSTFVKTNIRAFPEMISGSTQAVSKILSGRGSGGNFLFYGLFALMLVVATIAETVAARGLRKFATNIPVQKLGITGSAFKTLGSDLIADFIKLAAFIVVALVAAQILFQNPDDQFIATSFILFTVMILRIAVILLRVTLAPNQPSKRLVYTDDWHARFINSHFLGVIAIISIGLFLVQVMRHFQIDVEQPFRFWLGLLLYICLVYVTLRSRKGLSSIIKGDVNNLTPGLERMAEWWPALSISLISIDFLIVNLGVSTGVINVAAGAGAFTIALIVLMPFFDTLLRGVIAKKIPTISETDKAVETAYYETRDCYVRIGRVILFAAVFVAIGRIWNIDYESHLGANLVSKGGGFLVIIGIGYLVWEIINLWINKQIFKGISGNGVGTAAASNVGGSRLSTILPLVRITLQIAIAVLTSLLALSQLGINITPLLAGAGVFGLAIGFGAQTLVKDIVSGIFFLMDDAFRIGEQVDVGGTLGVVEKISIRSMQLRDANGPVHIISYGDIAKLSNNSRDFAVVKLAFTVPFDTDMKKVKALFRQIGVEMKENPLFQDAFIEPFKFQGVKEVNDVGIVIRGKFTAVPGTQFGIRKEVYIKVQTAFEENGLRFARREVSVQIPNLDKVTLDKNTVDQIQAIGTAAAETALIDADKEKAAEIAKKQV